jgi:uncharacterized protein YbbK (DUF523 family)
MDGGLQYHRPKAEIRLGDRFDVLDGKIRVIDRNNRDVIEIILKGALAALNIALHEGISRAFLNDNCPSCGASMVYIDGELTSGKGVALVLLGHHRLEIIAAG